MAVGRVSIQIATSIGTDMAHFFGAYRQYSPRLLSHLGIFIYLKFCFNKKEIFFKKNKNKKVLISNKFGTTLT